MTGQVYGLSLVVGRFKHFEWAQKARAAVSPRGATFVIRNNRLKVKLQESPSETASEKSITP